MIVTFTGIRDIDPTMEEEVELAVFDAFAHGATTMRFGGALGADTMALTAADSNFIGKSVRRVVYVPFTLAHQPTDARAAIKAHADKVVELALPSGRKDAYLRRNDRMLEGADLLVAFWDGRTEGGTHYTIERARSMKIPVHVVPVASALHENPRLTGIDVTAKVFAVEQYDTAAPLTSLVLVNKAGRASASDQLKIVRELAAEIDKHPELKKAAVIAPMPRRGPGEVSDMLPIAELLADRYHYEVGSLERVDRPRGGQVRARRVRFAAREHERTFHYTPPVRRSGTVIILDNVITSGATMEGAIRAVRASKGGIPIGLAVLYGAALGAKAA